MVVKIMSDSKRMKEKVRFWEEIKNKNLIKIF
jgi:hypothetical protein